MVANPMVQPLLSKEAFQEQFENIVSNVRRVIKGKDEVIRMVLVAILADGHILLEDMPGTGKTMLARSLAQSLDVNQNRIQCTPDLLPSDVTGSPILDMQSRDFVFRRGPVFANVVLVDEINRATPKTQSALLEAMQERNVTVDGVTYPLPEPFIMIATENPIELAGTFPLPEAQLDRFLFKLSLGYPDRISEAEVMDANRRQEAIRSLQPVSDGQTIRALSDWAKEVTIADPVKMYMVDLVQATRSDPALQMGASTRAVLALMRSSAVLAASQGREDVYPEDVKRVLTPVLAHRLILTADATLSDQTVDKVIERILGRVKPPFGIG